MESTTEISLPSRKTLIGCGIGILALGITHTILKILYSIKVQRRLLTSARAQFVGRRYGLLAGVGPDLKKHMTNLNEFKLELLGKEKTILVQTPLFSNKCYFITTDPKNVKHILKDSFNVWNKPNPNKDMFFSLIREWIGEGIFLSPHGPTNGQLWSHSRKTASAIFTKDNFNDLMTHTFQDQAQVFLSVLDQNEKGKEIDMQKMFFAFTMDSIMKIFFGRTTQTMKGANDPYASAYDEAHRSLRTFFIKNILIVGLLDLLPWPLGPFKLGHVNGNMAKLLRKIDSDGRKFDKSLRTLKEISDEIITSKMKDPSLKNQRDLLSLFLNAQDENGETYAQPKHQAFLRHTVLNFVIAGRDTTACTLTWMFYILSTNPKIQEKLCQEIDQVLNGKVPNHDDLTPHKMPYLTGVLYETLRLYPPVPEDPKLATKDDVLPDGRKILAGSSMAYFPYGMGRNPEAYPEPLVVKPERWIPFSQPSDFDFPVFQAGHRICLGMKMAILETKILASLLLQKYTFTLLEGEQEKISPSLMITMSLSNSKQLDSHNLWLIPHRR